MAKFCTNCGIGLAEAAKFCPGCGEKCPEAAHKVQPMQQYIQQPQYAPPVPAKKKNKAPLIIAVVAGLCIIALIAVLANRAAPDPGGNHTTRPPASSHTPASAQQARDTKLEGVLWHCWHDPGYSEMYLRFESNGEFGCMERWTSNTYYSFGMTMGGITMWRERHKGTYSASNGILTLTYHSSERCDNPRMDVRNDDFGDNEQEWRPIELPETLSLAYTIRVEERTYLDIAGTLPPLEVFENDMTFTISGENID